jgi:hypothetical protein
MNIKLPVLEYPKWHGPVSPEPPDPLRAAAVLYHGSLNSLPSSPKGSSQLWSNPGDLVGLNPQPLPPKTLTQLLPNLSDLAAINPQPLPPRASTQLWSNPANLVALNPQPLPPGAIVSYLA